MWRVSALGGKLEPLTTLGTGELSHRWPQLLPGGSAVLFTIWNDIGWEPARLAAQHLDGSGRTIVLEAAAATAATSATLRRVRAS